jgi:hypothetical protein
VIRADIAKLDGYTVIINHKWEQLGYVAICPSLHLSVTVIPNMHNRIQVSDALVGMCWSGVVTFLILLVMELVIQGYRKARGIPEPVFQLVLDRDIVLDFEIRDEFWGKEGSRTGSAEIGSRGGGREIGGPAGEGLELVYVVGNGSQNRGNMGVGELDGREGSLRGSEGSGSSSLGLREDA